MPRLAKEVKKQAAKVGVHASAMSRDNVELLEEDEKGPLNAITETELEELEPASHRSGPNSVGERTSRVAERMATPDFVLGA